MQWRRVFQCSSAVLHYSSHPEPIQWIVSLFPLNGCKRRFGEGWMSSTLLWFRCPLLMFTSRTSTQLNWEIIKQTHQTGCLLQCQSSRRKTLIKCVGSQTRWREATRACMCFNIWQHFSTGDERLGLAPTSFIFSKSAVIAKSCFDGQTECVSSHRFKGSALSQLMAFLQRCVRRRIGCKTHSRSLVFLQ